MGFILGLETLPFEVRGMLWGARRQGVASRKVSYRCSERQATLEAFTPNNARRPEQCTKSVRSLELVFSGVDYETIIVGALQVMMVVASRFIYVSMLTFKRALRHCHCFQIEPQS